MPKVYIKESAGFAICIASHLRLSEPGAQTQRCCFVVVANRFLSYASGGFKIAIGFSPHAVLTCTVGGLPPK
jgi:hypothetical protein